MKFVLVLAALTAQARAECTPTTLDFVVLQGDATAAAIEDDIRADLAEVGINAVARFLEKDDKNKAMIDGDFDIVFSETWGAPCKGTSATRACGRAACTHAPSVHVRRRRCLVDRAHVLPPRADDPHRTPHAHAPSMCVAVAVFLTGPCASATCR